MGYKDPLKQKAFQREHYLRNKALFNERVKTRRNRIKDWLNGIKSDRGCNGCQNKDYRVLDFHHLRDKIATISDMAREGYSEKEIEEETEKCVVLCANCHRIHHQESLSPVQS